MIFTVDSSITESVLQGGEHCINCLNAICQHASHGIVIDEMQRDFWMRRCFFEKENPRAHFFVHWFSTMREKGKIRLQRVDNIERLCRKLRTAVQPEIWNVIREHVRLVALACRSDRVVLYCARLSQACELLSSHPYSETAKIQWKISSKETADWIRESTY